ncbi:PREDICTED: X-box-binding protein 1 [Ceratosolen solmsi marchali]|uniref:X-box-binding protein 1 n=1 Tax=Ceratosolen solmsi marchali TaxID=326594 RepID=A0AAJ6YCX3_9HYME|nr:PREDICTED: X-box-binding protein 1 [Ceratosolen solmsi marchali]
MNALKSVIITLPSAETTEKPAAKLNFTAASILVDKLKLGTAGKKLGQLEHMEMAAPDSLVADEFDLAQEYGGLVAVRGKKRRLDHLTWEEKLQRKKLKNRVAAQTSRDRKKAKLDELEETVRLLKERNDILVEECAMLRAQNELLVSESRRLKRGDGESESKASTGQVCSRCQACVGCTVPALGSAVSPLNPLQQGGTVQTARSLTLKPDASVLLKILTLYLLSKIYLASSKRTITSSDSKSSQKAFCERLPPKWKRVLLDQMSSRTQSRKNVSAKNLTIQNQWWGRHHVMWKPIHPVEA